MVPAPARMLDDGGVEDRVRLVRPAGRDTMAGEALAASSWQEAAPSHWRAMGALRVEVEGPADTDLPALKRLGCTTEIVSWRTRVLVPGAAVLARLLERWPLGEGATAG